MGIKFPCRSDQAIAIYKSDVYKRQMLDCTVLEILLLADFNFSDFLLLMYFYTPFRLFLSPYGCVLRSSL